MFGDAPVSVETIQNTVSETWGIGLEQVEYARIGYGSYHWYVWEPDGTRWLVTLDRVDARPIREAYHSAQAIAADLPFVRGPSPNVQGKPTAILDEWWVTLWPRIEGRTGGRHGNGICGRSETRQNGWITTATMLPFHPMRWRSTGCSGRWLRSPNSCRA